MRTAQQLLGGLLIAAGIVVVYVSLSRQAYGLSVPAVPLFLYGIYLFRTGQA